MTNVQNVLKFKEKTITIVGTAHISQESVDEVKNIIREKRPSCTVVELDEKRKEAMKNPMGWQELDIIKVLKAKQGFLMLANLVLASFQKKMGGNVGVKPGAEMMAAMEVSEELGIPVVLADRPVHITLRRAWAKNSIWGKSNLLASLISAAFSNEKVSSEEIEKLKKESEMDSMMAELSETMPALKKVFIDERDIYLATNIFQVKGNDVVAVLGAGHVAGVAKCLEEIAAGRQSMELDEISSVPNKSIFSKIMTWFIPLLIVMLIAAGFYIGGKDAGSKLALSWVLWNGILAAIGTAIAGGHPVTILTSFVGAPITSLCPFIGVGVVSGLVQASICKPKVKDMENLSEDAAKFKGFYKNRILRVLLVFALSSIGSSLGTFIAGADILTALGSFIKSRFFGLN